MEVKIIRGYRLKLWKERLNLSEYFINGLDLTSINYVYYEKQHKGYLEVVVFTKSKKSGGLLPTRIEIPNEHVPALIERIEINGN